MRVMGWEASAGPLGTWGTCPHLGLFISVLLRYTPAPARFHRLHGHPGMPLSSLALCWQGVKTWPRPRTLRGLLGNLPSAWQPPGPPWKWLWPLREMKQEQQALLTCGRIAMATVQGGPAGRVGLAEQQVWPPTRGEVGLCGAGDQHDKAVAPQRRTPSPHCHRPGLMSRKPTSSGVTTGCRFLLEFSDAF